MRMPAARSAADVLDVVTITGSPFHGSLRSAIAACKPDAISAGSDHDHSRWPRDSGHYSTTMCLHLPCLNLSTDRTQRVKWPRTMADQTPAASSLPRLWSVQQRPKGTSTCETSVM